jgi:hypothetical protein
MLVQGPRLILPKRLTYAAGAAHPVHIVLMVIGHIIVDHQHKVPHIQPACSHCRQAGRQAG